VSADSHDHMIPSGWLCTREWWYSHFHC